MSEPATKEPAKRAKDPAYHVFAAIEEAEGQHFGLGHWKRLNEVDKPIKASSRKEAIKLAVKAPHDTGSGRYMVVKDGDLTILNRRTRTETIEEFD